MKAKEKLIQFIQGLPEKDIKKIFSDVVKHYKTQEMSDFLLDTLNSVNKVKVTGEKETTMYLNDEWLFQLDYKNKWLLVRYSKIWKVFEEKYGLNYSQIRDFAAWIETNTGWRGLTPTCAKNAQVQW